MRIINQNPFRVLGVLSNSPLKERVGNQNRLTAFAKVGREMAFPNDFDAIIPVKPRRASEDISLANTTLNLDKDQLKNALFWFINGSPIDDIALKHLQSGNVNKARELFEKKETFSSLVNTGVLQLIEGNYADGFSNISIVIHNKNYRSELLSCLGLQNITMSEDEIATMFIEEILKEVPAAVLLSGTSNPNDKAIISKTALEAPIATINSAIATAKSANTRNSVTSLEAGTKLMNSTKEPLKLIREIVGASSPQYQMVADNLAKQILQCGINYYNNAPDDDIEAPRKAMVLQGYALQIAVGQLTKDRCQENYKIIKEAVDNMPPAEVAIETRKVKEELRKFCALPDKIEYSITLLNNTKPLLQAIKSKLGVTNAFYLSLSTQVVGNALHNLIEEVNSTQKKFGVHLKTIRRLGINPSLINEGATLFNSVKNVISEAWKATTIMDSFDMEHDFRVKKYESNRKSLKDLCNSLDISTYSSSWRSSTTSRTSSYPSTSSQNNHNNSKSKNDGWSAYWIVTITSAIVGGLINDGNGAFAGAVIGALILGNIARLIAKEV